MKTESAKRIGLRRLVGSEVEVNVNDVRGKYKITALLHSFGDGTFGCGNIVFSPADVSRISISRAVLQVTKKAVKEVV